MPAEATVSALKLWAGTHGAPFQQDVDKEVRCMRARLASGANATTTRLLAKHFVYGMEPAVVALHAGTAVFTRSEASQLGESVYDAFKVCCALYTFKPAVRAADGFGRRLEASGQRFFRIYEGSTAVNHFFVVPAATSSASL